MQIRLVRSVLFAALALACSACNGGSNGGTGGAAGKGGAGGKGTGGSGPMGSGDCATVCTHIAAASCGTDEPTCLTSCQAADAMIASSTVPECKSEYLAYKECIGVATLVCDPPDVQRGACRGHYDHYQDYCTGISKPTDPCLTLPSSATDPYKPICAAMAGAPANPKLCRGVIPSGCVVGGTNLNTDLYCCP